MAKRKTPARKGVRPGKGAKPKAAKPRRRPIRWLWRRLRWGIYVPILAAALAIGLYAVVNPPLTHTMYAEWRRLGELDRQWQPMEEIAPVVARSFVAAEDANFCLHWGFDMDAIRGAVASGGRFGASTISQQTVKNVYLWQGRSWVRKALEALMTPAVEAVWSKRRILEVYLNVAEMGEGVFGIDAAAHRYFGKGPDALTAREAARLAVILPNPKQRDPRNLSPSLQKRARQVQSGAATIAADGRSDCFED